MNVEPKRATCHERDIDTLPFDEVVSRFQDIDNRQRALTDFLSRNGRRSSPHRAPFQDANLQPASNVVAVDPMDFSTAIVRNRGPLIQEERERRRVNWLCYYCGEPGHKSSSCSRKNQPSLAGRIVEVVNEASVLSENDEAL
ncbi:hypothetical protein K3495_g7623 [Podosphaera aphanis]|nr:hypothetical protein K3495_g7623 [Podosphaera aphanis]